MATQYLNISTYKEQLHRLRELTNASLIANEAKPHLLEIIYSNLVISDDTQLNDTRPSFLVRANLVAHKAPQRWSREPNTLFVPRLRLGSANITN